MKRSHFVDNVIRMMASVDLSHFGAARFGGVVTSGDRRLGSRGLLTTGGALCVLLFASQGAFGEQAPNGMVKYDHPVFHNGHRVLYHGVWRGKGAKPADSANASAAKPEDAAQPSAASADAEAAANAAPAPAPAKRLKAANAVAAPAAATRHEFAILVDTEDACAARMGAELVAALRANGVKARDLAGKTSTDYLAKYVASDAGDVIIAPVDALVNSSKTADWRAKAPFVAKLGRETLEIIGPRAIADLKQLNGKAVSLGSSDSDADVAGRAFFARLGVNPKFVNQTPASSFADLAAGKIDAVVVLGAANSKLVTDFGKGGRFHLIPAPWSQALKDGGYAPVRVAAKDRPNLVEADSGVETVAAQMVLVALDAAPGSNRAAQDGALVAALFEKFDALLSVNNDASWREVNLAASMDWPRLTAAKDWIEAHRPAAAPALDTFKQAAREIASAGGGPVAGDADKLYQSLLQARGAQP